MKTQRTASYNPAARTLTLTIPFTVRRHGGRRVIQPPVDAHEWMKLISRKLVIVLARAYRWQDLLDKGEFASLTDLARAIRKEKGYVSKVLRLAGLAPDIVTAILEGKEPDGLTIKKLFEVDWPVDWEAQRRMLGFSVELK